MLLLVAFIVAIFVVITELCYLQRLWYFQDIKSIKGAYPWPIVMDAINFRNSEKIMEYILILPKKFGTAGFKFSIGFDSCVALFKSESVSAVMNSSELITKGKDYKTIEPWLGTGLLLSTGKKWTQRRKLLTPTFHFSILRGFIPTFEAIGDVLIEILEQKSGKTPIDVSKPLSLYSLDVICETSLGVSIDAQRNENHEYILAVRNLTELIVTRGISWWKRFEFLYKLSLDHKKFVALCDWVHNYTYNIIDQRRQTLTDFDDDLIDSNGVKKKIAFLDMLIKCTLDGMPLSNEDIREEVDTFMFEGHDTSSSALSFSLYCLSQHPGIQERLLREQKEIFGEDLKSVHATYEDLHKMDYLDMVIKEVLRLFPPVPIFSREAKEYISTEFGTLKPGLQVGMSPFVTQRLPEYFPDPEKFDPERFSLENINNIKPFTYIPFSGGYRNCIGQKFAMLSMKSAISKIVRNFKIHPDLTYKPILAFEVILKSKNGVRVIIEKRP